MSELPGESQRTRRDSVTLDEVRWAIADADRELAEAKAQHPWRPGREAKLCRGIDEVMFLVARRRPTNCAPARAAVRRALDELAEAGELRRSKGVRNRVTWQATRTRHA